MFKAGQPNPYDDVVAKTTDENLTAENWELILNLCDKVQDEGEAGARNVIAAVLKRLAHRNPNVQLYTLSLAESLSKNCSIELHREIASKAFTQGLEKLITDRNTHEKVRRRALGLIELWAAEFENDPTLGIMEDCYNSLKAKNYKFEAPPEPAPPSVDDEVRRKEEEELQRVLELSMQDKGGRSQWEAYSLASSSGASGSNSQLSGLSGSTSSPASGQTFHAPPASSGYVPASSVPPQAHMPATDPPIATAVDASPTTKSHGQANVPVPVSPTNPTPTILVTRVRALHTFEPTEPGELAFDKGDIIKVVDRGYKDWWRGQLRGRTGIFPVNYVEPMPEPTPAELAKEAEKEAAVFSQAVDVDRLLTMLKALDPSKDNLADNEEIQELYRSCMALRPKIVKLIDKYSQKRADLVSMNESFVKARNIFDSMMEESLTRHTQMYGTEYTRPQFVRPGSASGGPQAYGWNPSVYEQPGYNAYPAPAIAYQQPPGPELYNGQPQSLYPQQHGQPQHQPPSSVYQSSPTHQQQHQQQPANTYQQPPGGFVEPSAGPYSAYSGQPYEQQPAGYGRPPSPQAHPQLQGGPQLQGTPQPQPQPQSAQPQGVLPQSQGTPPQVQHQPIHLQPQGNDHLQQQSQSQLQSQSQPQSQPQAHSQTPQNQQTGPPYIYDPATHYSDSNVQAWAQYYAQGGKDPTGAVYFISVPGVKEPAPASATSVPQENLGSSPSITNQPTNQQFGVGQGQDAFGRPQQTTSPTPLSPVRKQSFGRGSTHNSQGTGYPLRQASIRTGASGSVDEELKNPYEDSNLQNPYDLYAAGGPTATGSSATEPAGPEYGASPYYGGGTDGKHGQGYEYGQPIVGQ